MNKEYVYLSKDEMLIIDDTGKATKRNVEYDNMHDLLKVENNLETIVNLINELEKSLKNPNEFSSYSKMEKIITCLLPLIPAMMTLGGITVVEGQNILEIFLYGVPITCTASYAIFGIPYVLSNKNRVKTYNALRSELERAYKLKNSYESKLEAFKSKERQQEQIKPYTNEIISLEDSMELPEEDIKQLAEAFKQGYGPSVKKLRLRKN